MTFLDWVWMVLKKGIWMLGFIPQLLDYMSVYLPRKYLPSQIQSLLERGGNWQTTLVLVSIGLLLSAFLVHLETLEALDKRDLRIRELEGKQPHLVVGLQDENRRLTETLGFELTPVPPRPDFDKLVEDKRQALMANAPGSKAGDWLLSSGLVTSNPNYEEEVERYLVIYGQRLVDIYEYSIDRVYTITPIIENRGSLSADNITVEFALPAHCVRSMDNIYEIHEAFNGTDGTLEEVIQYMMLPEPEPVTSQIASISGQFHSFDVPKIHDTLATLKPKGDIDGPNFKQRNGTHIIEYELTQLTPKHREDDFEPFDIWLGEVTPPTVFEIPFTLYASGLQRQQEGCLYLDISLSQSRDTNDIDES